MEAAAAAQEEWANTDAGTRGAYLREVAKLLDDREEELTETLVREEGKTRSEANPEVNRAIDIFYYYAERAMDYNGENKNPTGADQNLYYVREPMGVAGLVTPWNYPIAIPAWKMAPALATGNTVAIKPAKNTPNCVRMIFEAFDEAGLPDGVANYVTGSGSEVGSAIVEHEAVDCVSFTGSRQVGDQIYEQATDDHKRIQTELGSKNPTLVMPSTDVEEAAATVGGAAFGALPGFAVSAGYWPIALLIALYGVALLRSRPAFGRGLLIGAAILTVSLSFRSVDMAVCARVPLGTHFVWHILNGILLFWMIEIYRRHFETELMEAKEAAEELARKRLRNDQ